MSRRAAGPDESDGVETFRISSVRTKKKKRKVRIETPLRLVSTWVIPSLFVSFLNRFWGVGVIMSFGT